MVQKISKELAKHRLEQAKEDLEAGKLLYDKNFYKSANNRAYYSIFHSIKAVLALEPIDFKRHKDVLAYFNKNYINKIINNKSTNYIEDYLIDEGSRIIKKAQETLSLLDLEIYFSIIKRSMKRYEICLGRVDESSLKRDKNEIIYIRSNKYIVYDLLESDCYNYIKKIKRRKKGYGINNIIDEFVNKSALDQGSIKYLRILSIYPNESMKILNKCRNGRIDITNEDVVSKFRNAKECDGIKLL